MQFKKASEPLAERGSSARASVSPRGRRPQWLVEWIDEQGQYVLLECGHTESFANVDATLCLLRTFTGLEVICEHCNRFVKVTRAITFTEYENIPLPVYAPDPPF